LFVAVLLALPALYSKEQYNIWNKLKWDAEIGIIF
jgi:hypothetical protein